MSENNQKFSWLGQLDKLFDTVEDSTSKALKELSGALNYLDPEAPIAQEGKKTFNPIAPTTNLNNSNQKELISHSPSDSTQKNEMRSVYDIAFEEFKKKYSDLRKSKDPEENINTITDEKQLRLDFNKRIQCLFLPNLYLYSDARYSESHNKDLRAAFSITCKTSVENRKEELEAYYSRNIDKFKLLTEQDIKSIKKFQESKGIGLNLESKDIAPENNQDHLYQKESAEKNQYFTSKKPQYKKVPGEECPDIFSFFGQHVETATTFLTNTVSYLSSFIIGPYGTPDSQSNQDSVQQKTATMPTTSQTPTTAPELGEYKTKIGPMQKAVDFYENTPPQLRSLIGLNSPSNSSRSH